MFNTRKCQFAAAFVSVLLVRFSYADVTEYEDKFNWEAVVGEFTTIDFTDYPSNTVITDQYLDQGILFTDGDDIIAVGSYFNDSRGLHGDGIITVVFIEPMNWIGVDYPGAVKYELFNDGQLLYASSDFGEYGAGHFAGLVSSVQFDKVILSDWVDGYVAIDDLHFGAFVPGAGSGILLIFYGVFGRRRHQ